MIYYETIKPLALYKAHKIKEVEVICKEPAFCDSPWIRVITEEGRYFYMEERNLEDMQKYPDCYPLEERGLFAPAQTGKSKRCR